MKALSVKQPWAELIASGRKTLEIRSWSTRYRGELLIVSGLRFDARGPVDTLAMRDSYAIGVRICLVDLVDVRPATPDDEGASCAPRELLDGAYAWVLNGVRRVDPLDIKGRLGLFTVP